MAEERRISVKKPHEEGNKLKKHKKIEIANYRKFLELKIRDCVDCDLCAEQNKSTFG